MCVHLEQSLWTRFCTLQILEFSLLLLYHLRASNWTAYYLSGSESAMFVWDVISPVTWPCLDVNECAEQPGICGIGTCVNKDGNFSCICPDGHIMLPDGHTCMGQCSHSLSSVMGLTFVMCSFQSVMGLILVMLAFQSVMGLTFVMLSFQSVMGLTLVILSFQSSLLLWSE